jgi:hypothetical protein
MNEDLTLADLVGLDEKLEKLAPDWIDEPPFLVDKAQENERAKHIEEVLSKVKYKRYKIRWLIAGIKPHLLRPWFRITALTRVRSVDGGGLISLVMEDVEVPPDISDSDIVRRAFWVLERFEQHELREHFWYEGDKVYDPHSKPLPSFDYENGVE